MIPDWLFTISDKDSQGPSSDQTLLAGIWELGQTPIDSSRLEYWLQNYDNTEKSYLIYGFREGFKLEYSGPRHPYRSKNLYSAILNPDLILSKLSKEVALGRMLGPFVHEPFPNLRTNGIGLIPKNSGGMRLITHLSYPYGNSVNDFIDPYFSSVHYSKFDNVIDIIQRLGKGAIMGKRDIKSAFNLCPVHPDDFNILGIYFDNKYWIQKMLPQGCSISPAIFERFATFLQWAVSEYTKSKNIDHYLDDYFFAGKAKTSDCSNLITAFEYLCHDMKIPINEEKSEGPVTTLIYLGLEIDSVLMEIRVPEEKIKKAKAQIIEAISKKKIKLKHLQAILGSLNFFTKAIPTGRTFSCRLYQAQAQAKLPHHYIRINNDMKEDLNMWLTFLNSFNGTAIMSDLDWISDESMNLYTDAAGNKTLGCGAYLNGEWIVYKWPDRWCDEIFRDITLLELVPILLAFFIWGFKLKGKKIILHCDNMSLVHILNRKSSRNKKVLILLRQLVLILLNNNIQIKAVHIASKANSICDAISRFQFSKVECLLPNLAHRVPKIIPLEFQNYISTKLADY